MEELGHFFTGGVEGKWHREVKTFSETLNFNITPRPPAPHLEIMKQKKGQIIIFVEKMVNGNRISNMD